MAHARPLFSLPTAPAVPLRLHARGLTALDPSSFSLSPFTSSIPFASFPFHTLPFLVSRNSFICHSYENTAGVCGFFPFRNSAPGPATAF